MKTLSWTIDPTLNKVDLLRNKGIHEAAALLKSRRLVAFPTETVYGLGADACSSEAVSAIFTAKNRPPDNPLIVHVADRMGLPEWVQLTPLSEALMQHFCPGPLTLVLPHRGAFAQQTTAGLSTVGIRMPSHPIAQALLQVAGIPIAAPSANRSGKPSPTEAVHVWQDLAGRIDGIVDGGRAGVGVESTVVDVTGDVPLLLRPGGVTLEALRARIGEVHIDPGIGDEQIAPRSPGMKYRHYAPQGELWLVEGESTEQRRHIGKLVAAAQEQGRSVAVLTTREHRGIYPPEWVVLSLGERNNPPSVAQGLYRALRECDEKGIEVIYGETFPYEGIFASVMNRLLKAAEGRVIKAKPASSSTSFKE